MKVSRVAPPIHKAIKLVVRLLLATSFSGLACASVAYFAACGNTSQRIVRTSNPSPTPTSVGNSDVQSIPNPDGPPTGSTPFILNSGSSPPEGVRFATSARNGLTVWRTTATGIGSKQTFDLPGRIVDIGWLDADTPLVMFEDQSVVRVIEGGVVPFPPAPDTAWFAARPKSGDYDTDALEPDSWPGRLVVLAGQVWIERCLWRAPAEGSDYCVSFRSVRVYPTFAQQDETLELPPQRELPTVAAPQGYRVFEREEHTPEGATVKSVACEAPGQGSQAVRLFATDDRDGFAQRFPARNPRWIRTSPPRFVVTTIMPGMDAYDAEVVVDGCPVKSTRIISQYRVGPAGLWAWTQDLNSWELEGIAGVVPPFAVEHFEFAPTR